ncbi:MAG: hypothetical protein M0Q91_01625, partial [Methanoregula sp.]|nr:hypothetical protein [Methanoregula sp.]
MEPQNLPESRDISVLNENMALINSSIDVLNRAIASEKNIPPQNNINGDWTAVADNILELGRRQEELESSSRNIIGKISEWEHWGDVDLNQVQHLGQKGIYLKLYQVPVKEIRSFPDDVIVKTIYTAGDFANCVTISRRQFECAFPEIVPPKQSLSLLKKQCAGNTEELDAIKGKIIESACFFEAFLGIKKIMETEIEFQQVV